MIGGAEPVISKELDPGERLLWTGAPRHGVVLRGSDAFMIPFSILWCGFAVFWEAAVLRSQSPGFFALWGVPFVLVGLYFVFGRFVVDSAARARTSYGVTDRRAIIVSSVMSRSVKSLSLRTLTDLSLTECGDGSGTISFGSVPPWAGMYSGMRWLGTGQFLPPSFELIKDAKRVYNLIRQAQVSK